MNNPLTPVEELKPCPFCGGAVHFHGKQDDDTCDGCHYIYCSDCGLMIDMSFPNDQFTQGTLAELQAAIVPKWNRRTSR